MASYTGQTGTSPLQTTQADLSPAQASGIGLATASGEFERTALEHYGKWLNDYLGFEQENLNRYKQDVQTQRHRQMFADIAGLGLTALGGPALGALGLSPGMASALTPALAGVGGTLAGGGTASPSAAALQLGQLPGSIGAYQDFTNRMNFMNDAWGPWQPLPSFYGGQR